ncbi:hypothetical protein DPMN_155391 [Dreissena polymorpha]|uniref:Uncharacterized protein n=1 Tax=Dreissena polymorpha TaxID=45954 RepID=A0A9D4FMW0_DREPO|nr:hypothetical protein DPMN_155391 [Dreissena polymorpha]
MTMTLCEPYSNCDVLLQLLGKIGLIEEVDEVDEINLLIGINGEDCYCRPKAVTLVTGGKLEHIDKLITPIF